MPVTRAHSPRERQIQAAGAILWRPGLDGPELALIHRPRYDDWSFPKGKQEPGEHIQLTALREVFEETGQRMVMGRRLPMISYPVAGVPKQVRYWAGRVRSVREGGNNGGGRFTPNDEVDRLAWLTPAEAERRLSRRLDATVLEAFMAAPVDTVPIVLLRHGTAERRSKKYPDDRIRPLTANGQSQAEALPELLAGFGQLSVISSPAVRCVDTVRPFAGKQHSVIDVDPALSETAHAAAPRAAASWIRALISEGTPTVVCSHRSVLDDLLAAALPPAGQLDGLRVNGRPSSAREAARLFGPDHSSGGRLALGSAWVLHVTPRLGPRKPPRLVAVDRLRP